MSPAAGHRRRRAGRGRLARRLRGGGPRRVSSFRAEEAVRSGRRGSAKLAQVAADPTRYLNVALLVRVACEMAAAVLVTYACLKEFDETWEASSSPSGSWSSSRTSPSGVSPRTIGRQHPLNTATAASYVLLPLARIMGPIPPLLILIGNALTPGKGFGGVRSPPRPSCARWSTSPRRSR